MEESGIIDFVKKNKDMQHIINEILKGKGRIEIDYDKGRIKRKSKSNKF